MQDLLAWRSCEAAVPPLSGPPSAQTFPGFLQAAGVAFTVSTGAYMSCLVWIREVGSSCSVLLSTYVIHVGLWDVAVLPLHNDGSCLQTGWEETLKCMSCTIKPFSSSSPQQVCES